VNNLKLTGALGQQSSLSLTALRGWNGFWWNWYFAVVADKSLDGWNDSNHLYTTTIS